MLRANKVPSEWGSFEASICPTLNLEMSEAPEHPSAGLVCDSEPEDGFFYFIETIIGNRYVPMHLVLLVKF